jgi:hypothetical protein
MTAARTHSACTLHCMHVHASHCGLCIVRGVWVVPWCRYDESDAQLAIELDAALMQELEERERRLRGHGGEDGEDGARPPRRTR